MCAKQLWKNDISSKDAGHWLESLLKISSTSIFLYFTPHFAINYLAFFVSGTFAARGLKTNTFNKNFAKLCLEKKLLKKCYKKIYQY